MFHYLNRNDFRHQPLRTHTPDHKFVYFPQALGPLCHSLDGPPAYHISFRSVVVAGPTLEQPSCIFVVDRFVRVRLTLSLLHVPCAFLLTVHRHSYNLALPKGANVAIEDLVTQNYDEVYLSYIVINNVLRAVFSSCNECRGVCVALPSDPCELRQKRLPTTRTRSVLLCK